MNTQNAYLSPLGGGLVIGAERGFQLIYYKSGEYVGHVIGWEFRQGRWISHDMGTPQRAVNRWTGYREIILKLAED